MKNQKKFEPSYSTVVAFSMGFMFIFLKLVNKIDWPWIEVFTPFIAYFIYLAFISILGFSVVFFVTVFTKYWRRKK